MKINIEAVAAELEELQKYFNNLITAMDTVVQNGVTICDTSKWDSSTRDHFYELFNSIIENYFTVINKCNNTLQYLITLINNYTLVEQSNTATFNNFGSNHEYI